MHGTVHGTNIPAPGVLLPTLSGEHRMHLHCQGSGQPTVILDAGLGGDSLEWVRVQGKLAESTRVCSYDRGGLGWSDAPVGPRTAGRMASDLHRLLNNSVERGPFVLVGHSFSAYTLRIFARRYPAKVAGMVLVDPSHEEQILRFYEESGVNIAPSNERGQVFYRPELPPNLPEEWVSTAKRLLITDLRISTTRNELLGFRTSAAQVASAPELPDVPIIILSRGSNAWPQNERGMIMEALWRELHEDLAARAPMGELRIVPGSGHHIHLEQPDSVIDGIQSVMEQVRLREQMAGEPTLRRSGIR
ncbi:alpha/beta hydrolase [Methylonatrum kenyense]|uniref:alpha/beta fold hydrolase n=1 Tax=Methylonatrum kenyense TaxID=455253 RepID=UPI0020C160A0|nr:alpha/beta hydrolase [Methylonatrum kenyense]MCK8515404.1 alpha/beta hydrolase [Methylonatrum kenyense]